MGSSDGEGLSQLELVDAYKKIFILQNGQVAVLKCSPIWKKMRKKIITSSEHRLCGSQDPLKGCSMKIEILTQILFFFI